MGKRRRTESQHGAQIAEENRERVLEWFHRMPSPSVLIKVIGVFAFFFQGLVDG